MHHNVVHSYLGLPQLQMGRLQTLPAQQVPTDEAGKHIHQICPGNRKRRSQSTRTNKKRGSHNDPQHNRQMQEHTWHHARGMKIHSHHLLADTNISTHHQQADTCTHHHLLHHSSIYLKQVRSLYNKILPLLLHSNRWLSSTSNILRQVRTRQKPLRTSPMPHPSLPLWAASQSMMEKTRMHALNGYKDARKQANTLATTSDQLYYRDPPKMWLRSFDHWMKNSHMTS